MAAGTLRLWLVNLSSQVGAEAVGLLYPTNRTEACHCSSAGRSCAAGPLLDSLEAGLAVPQLSDVTVCSEGVLLSTFGFGEPASITDFCGLS